MKRLARRPLLHFALLGGGLFLIAHGSARGRWAQTMVRAPVTISAAALESERRAFVGRAGRAPTAAEMAGLAGTLVDDELLWREAVALRLDRDDPVVRRRLVRNLRFLRGIDAAGVRGVSGAAGGDDKALYTEALALGLDRSDEVVRRRLVERMRLRIQEQARAVEPADAEIDAYVARHRTRFAEPERIGLTQIFLSRERRGPRLAADARDLLARLMAANVAPADAVRFGDPGLTPARLAPQSRRSLARRFGAAFAEDVLRQGPGGWGGPVASAYGLHLVWVHEVVPPRSPSPASVRGAARELLLAERADAALGDALRALRARYEIRMPDGVALDRARREPPLRTGGRRPTAVRMRRGPEWSPSKGCVLLTSILTAKMLALCSRERIPFQEDRSSSSGREPRARRRGFARCFPRPCGSTCSACRKC